MEETAEFLPALFHLAAVRWLSVQAGTGLDRRYHHPAHPLFRPSYTDLRRASGSFGGVSLYLPNSFPRHRCICHRCSFELGWHGDFGATRLWPSAPGHQTRQ